MKSKVIEIEQRVESLLCVVDPDPISRSPGCSLAPSGVVIKDRDRSQLGAGSKDQLWPKNQKLKPNWLQQLCSET